MATGFLDKTGVSTLWSKIKQMVDTRVSKIEADISGAVNELNSVLGDPSEDPSAEEN